MPCGERQKERGERNAVSAVTLTSAATLSEQGIPPFPSPSALEHRAEQGLRAGWFDDAERCCRLVLCIAPNSPQALGILALTRQRRGQAEEGVCLARRALALAPTVGLLWFRRGIVRQTIGRPVEAEADYRRALALAPSLGEAWGHLGLVLQRRGAPVVGEGMQRRALRLDGPDAVPLFNLGCCLEAQGRIAAAEHCYHRAAALRPDMAQVHVNLGYAALAADQDGKAEAAFRRAARLMPSLAAAHWNLGLGYLKKGWLDAGWRHYEYRFTAAGVPLSFPMARWNGASLNGRRLLVWREQGLGDELLFASCYPDLERLNSPVTIECDPRLLGLFGRSFPWADLRGAGRPVRSGDADLQIPAGSLPQVCRFRLARIPARTAYLQPDPVRLAWWRQRLEPIRRGRLLVGIGWRSQKVDAYRQNAYTDLADWGPVLTLPGTAFINLQYDDCAAEIRRAEDRWGVPIHGFDHLDLKHDLEGLAALIAALDLVIVPATAAGELAGALGVPVWRLCRADWTRLGTTGTRPWFPSHRTFSPSPGQPMGDMLLSVAVALRRLAQRDTSLAQV